jgi:hypothetical protein
MSSSFLNNIKVPKIITKYTFYLLIIITITVGIRLYYFSLDVPLNLDSLYYFWYSSNIFHYGELPKEWAPNNLGWPIFVSYFFILVDSKDIFTLMQIQKLVSILVSILIIIPTYFLCKKFVAKKFAIIGASFIAFDPRLMINSFLGSTDSFYILLITTSLVLFFSSNKKINYLSFVLISFATVTRGEGVIFFILLSLMFIIKYRNEGYKILFKYIIPLGIFLSIILPISIYQLEVNNVDTAFTRNVISVNSLISGDSEKFIGGIELFLKYLIWVLIPNFIIFIPLGIFLIFKSRNFEKNTIILLIVLASIPAFWAYMNNIQETRYLYVLFPMFSVLSVLSIEKIIGKRNRSNIIIGIIISSILVFSLIFYDQIKIDYEHEKEAFEIMDKIFTMVTVTNVLYQESSYFKTSQTIEQWPNKFTDMGSHKFEIILLSTSNFNSLEEYIIQSEKKGLTHIIIDNKKERPNFLINVFNYESDHPYLQKIYDSKTDGFTYHVKVFEINYELFDSIVNKRE